MSMPEREPEPFPTRRSRLLRGAADGELSATEQAELEAHLAARPEDRAVLDFERRIRHEVGRALGTGTVPSELAARIEEIARDARRPRARRRWGILAAAAALATVALGLLAVLASDPDESGFAGRGRLVRFLATHPRDCPISIERTLQEFEVRRFDEALTTLGTLLGDAPALADLGHTDLEFRGMGRCGIPGEQASMHIMLMGAVGTPLEGSPLSVYVQRDDGRLPITEGTTYRLESKEEEFVGIEMFVWKRAGLDYFVVTPSAAAGRIALASVGAPSVTAVL